MKTILKFEALLEGEENKLTGGFSSSVSSNSSFELVAANNCHGGNCVKGCGAGVNRGECGR